MYFPRLSLSPFLNVTNMLLSITSCTDVVSATASAFATTVPPPNMKANNTSSITRTRGVVLFLLFSKFILYPRFFIKIRAAKKSAAPVFVTATCRLCAHPSGKTVDEKRCAHRYDEDDKSEIEKEREKVVQQRLAFEAGVETRTDSDSVEGKIQNFLLQKMDFTEHYVDRDIISQFVDTVIPRSETCYEWYMDFDLIEKPNEKKKMVWSFKIDYNEAKTYRKEREGMLRPNQWEDLIVRVYI